MDRFLGGEWKQVPGYGNQPLAPTLDGDVKVFDLTIDAIKHQIDAQKDPLDALGYNGTWPGPQPARRRGRQGPGDLQEQPARDDRRPFPRPGPAERASTASR